MLEIRHASMDQAGNILDAYDDIYTGEGIMHRDSFYLWLIDLLRPVAGRSLLDISCGYGRLTVLARQQGLSAMGVDFSIAGVRQGTISSPESGWVVGNGECLPFPGASFDYITHIGSLEHFFNPQLGANEIGRLLKPGGVAVVLLPNAYGLLGNILKVMRTGEIHDDGQPLQRYGTRRFWENMLIAGGLRIERVTGWSEVERPRNRKDLSVYLRKPQKLLRFLIHPLIPVNLVNHLVYICGRA